MPSARTRVEILAVRAVEQGKTVPFVPHGVGMDKIHDHTQAHPVRRVDEGLQVLRRAEA